MFISVIKEAFLVGISSIVVGTIIGFFVGMFISPELPEVCMTWNKYHAMEISLFLTGFFVHIISEYSGVNKWYCAHGSACV